MNTSTAKGHKIINDGEQAERKKHECLKTAKQAWKKFSDRKNVKDSNGRYTKKFRETVYRTCEGQFDMENYSLKIQKQYAREYYTMLAECGGVNLLCDLIIDIVSRDIIEDEQVEEDLHDLVLNALNILCGVSDSEINRTEVIMNHSNYVNFVVSSLRKWTEVRVSFDEQDSYRENVIINFLGQLHNFAMHDKNIARLRELGTVAVLIPYMKCSTNTGRLLSLAALPDIVDEKESKSISTDQEILKFLLKTLEGSMDEEMRRKFGFSTTELARTVRQVARNDANKRLLVKLGVLEQLVNLTKYEDENEQEEALGALWSLSFDEENQNAMIFDKKMFPGGRFH